MSLLGKVGDMIGGSDSQTKNEIAGLLSNEALDSFRDATVKMTESINKIIEKDFLDLSEDIYGNGSIKDIINQQSKPIPTGDLQPAKEPAPEKKTEQDNQQPEAQDIDPETLEKAKNFNIDDYQSTTLEDGTRITNHPDGTVSVKGPDGTHVIYNPDGSKFTTYPDGTTVSEDSEGNKWTRTPDGKMDSEHQSIFGKIWDLIPSF